MKRLIDDWMLLLGVFVGITIAATLGAVAPLYLNALEQLSFNTSLDGLRGEHLHLNVITPNIALKADALDEADRQLGGVVNDHIAPFHVNREVYYRGEDSIVGLPDRPLSRAGQPGIITARGYLQHISNLNSNVDFVAGSMAGTGVVDGALGSEIEAVISTSEAEVFNVGVGDVTVLKPTLRSPREVTARIVGVFEPTDIESAFWVRAERFVLPWPLLSDPPPGVLTDEEEPSMSPFVTREALIEVMGVMNPGFLVDPIWFIELDKEAMQALTIEDTSERLVAFEVDVSRALPGSTGGTRPIVSLINTTQRQGFFAKIPLILLMTVMLVTVVFFLSMLVSYLVTSREGDMAMLKSRGVGPLYVFRLYALEGLAMTVVAFLIAPWLGAALVSAAGNLSYFRQITSGGPLPIEMSGFVFVAAGLAALPGLFTYVINGTITARGGLLSHKLRTSRPPTKPAFQRHYVDVALLIVGGLTFWEMRSRGALISGGLFKDVEVNEAMLFAPVLFLVVVALVFMRAFPMVVRFIGGESATLLDIVAAGAVAVLAPGVVVREYQAVDGVDWLGPDTFVLPALVVAAGLFYWLTRRDRRLSRIVPGLAIQIALIGTFFYLDTLDSGHFTLGPTVALAALVPAQVVFLLLKSSTKFTPVWLSMSLWRMARNPLQYTWLVLLLVLVTGLGILATTVGGTLERSQDERVRYEVGGDLLISGVPPFSFGGAQGLKDEYLSKSGVERVSVGYRTSASIGPHKAQVLAVEPDEFARISWYRDDFSERPLHNVMRSLEHDPEVERVVLPEGATHISIWTKPLTQFAFMSMWVVLEDPTGFTWNISLGQITSTEWTLRSAEIPSHYKQPLNLVSIQTYEPAHGGSQTPGTLLIDEVTATIGGNGEREIVEDFEGAVEWTTIATSNEFTDVLYVTEDEAHSGNRSAVFVFGNKAIRGLRGFYQGFSGTSLPIVVSESLAEEAGLRLGNVYQMDMNSQLIRVVVRDIVRYFPTLRPEPTGFIITDVDGLLLYLNILDYQSRTDPNEVVVAGTRPRNYSVQEDLGDLTLFSREIKDSFEELEGLSRNPLASAGWRAMILAAMGIVLVAAAFGYWSYLQLFAHRTRSEMGFLQSVGLSRRQLLGLLGFEHLTLAALGLGLGTWAGFQMSGLMVSPLAITESGTPVLPPFILVTEWNLMLPVYAGIVALFVAAIFVLHRSVAKLDLQSIARMGEG